MEDIMANLKLLQEAIAAFANGEQDIADKKMRKYFVEQAQEINKKLEESMEDEESIEDEDVEDEEKLDEDFDVQPDAGLNAEIQYTLGEEDESAEDEVEISADADADGEDDVDVDVKADAEVPSEDQWESIQDAFRGLQQMFDEIGDGEVDLDSDEEVEDSEEEVGVDGDDEFADIEFGDEKIGESFKLEKVAPVDKKEKAGTHTKSPVAPEAKSPVDGVEPVKFAKKTDQAPLVDLDDKSVLPKDNLDLGKNARGEMKDVKEPKTTASKSKSPLSKAQPKLK